MSPSLYPAHSEPPVFPAWLRWPAYIGLAVWAVVWLLSKIPGRDKYGDRIDGAWVRQRTLWFFGVWDGDRYDENFNACQAAAEALEDGSDESAASIVEVGDPTTDALLVERVEREVVSHAIRNWSEAGTKARDAVWERADFLLGMTKADAALALRLWDGCLDAAKTIADSTRCGRNWPWWRRRSAARIDDRCVDDPVYARGVRAAVAFKEGRKEHWSFLGVPRWSMIREGKLGR